MRSPLMLLVGQFADFMILVLLAAALISGFIGEPMDTVAILVILMLNAIIGAVQEFRAERAVTAQRQMSAPQAAVRREGHRIFDNIRKFIKYTMTSNSGEVWTLFLAPLLGLPGLTLTAEPAEPGTMQRPPRHPQESIFAHGMWQHIICVGLLIGALSIASQAWAYARGAEYWQTVVFTVLTLSQLFHSLAVRSERASLFRIGIGSNLPILGAALLTIGLQLAVIYTPALNPIFKTQAPPLFDLAACFAVLSLVLVAVEIEKFLVRRGCLYTQPASG